MVVEGSILNDIDVQKALKGSVSLDEKMVKCGEIFRKKCYEESNQLIEYVYLSPGSETEQYISAQYSEQIYDINKFADLKLSELIEKIKQKACPCEVIFKGKLSSIKNKSSNCWGVVLRIRY